MLRTVENCFHGKLHHELAHYSYFCSWASTSAISPINRNGTKSASKLSLSSKNNAYVWLLLLLFFLYYLGWYPASSNDLWLIFINIDNGCPWCWFTSHPLGWVYLSRDSLLLLWGSQQHASPRSRSTPTDAPIPPAQLPKCPPNPRRECTSSHQMHMIPHCVWSRGWIID